MSKVKFNPKAKAKATLTAKPEVRSGISLGGVFKVKCYDVDGNLKWEDVNHNTVTNGGIEDMLDVQFNSGTQVDPWYVGLKGVGSAAIGDTLASHSGWTEVTGYTGDRQAFSANAAASKAVNNTGNLATFPITGAATIAGAFLAGAATLNTAVLFCVENFSVARSVASDDTLTVEYTISGADA